MSTKISMAVFENIEFQFVISYFVFCHHKCPKGCTYPTNMWKVNDNTHRVIASSITNIQGGYRSTEHQAF